MTKYLLDTDICIFYLKKKFGIPEMIKQVGRGNCFVSEISVAELHYGIQKSANFDLHKNDVTAVLETTRLIPISASLEHFAVEKVRLQRLGTLIHDFDLLIATTAVYHGMTLVTNNTKHHQRVANVQLANWTVSV